MPSYITRDKEGRPIFVKMAEDDSPSEPAKKATKPAKKAAKKATKSAE